MSHYVIDRIEGKTAVVVGDDGSSFDVPTDRLPKGSREGTVLRIEGADDTVDWSRVVIDEVERHRRLERARETLRRMGHADPGGDIVL